jgi:hypothetical protein
MSALTWWRILALALFFYLQLVLFFTFYYLYGVCRLAEEKFGRSTFAPLLLSSFVFLFACSLALALSPAMPFGRPWFALCSSAAALLLSLVSFKCYQAMMGR